MFRHVSIGLVPTYYADVRLTFDLVPELKNGVLVAPASGTFTPSSFSTSLCFRVESLHGTDDRQADGRTDGQDA